MADVPLQVISENSSSERRITPSWTITQLKTKLEPVTGIPPCAQVLFIRPSPASPDKVAIIAPDEDSAVLASFPLAPYAELHVKDTRPPQDRPNYTDISGVEKYVMPESEYAQKNDSVLAWKKAQKLGRFDPDAPAHAAAKKAAFEADVKARNIEVGKRCRVAGDDDRRGAVMYVGEIPEIPGEGLWIGVKLDEPVGRNDGSVGGKRYWGQEQEGGGMKHGVFVRPERVDVGEWAPLDDLEDMEEI